MCYGDMTLGGEEYPLAKDPTVICRRGRNLMCCSIKCPANELIYFQKSQIPHTP